MLEQLEKHKTKLLRLNGERVRHLCQRMISKIQRIILMQDDEVSNRDRKLKELYKVEANIATAFIGMASMAMCLVNPEFSFDNTMMACKLGTETKCDPKIPIKPIITIQSSTPNSAGSSKNIQSGRTSLEQDDDVDEVEMARLKMENGPPITDSEESDHDRPESPMKENEMLIVDFDLLGPTFKLINKLVAICNRLCTLNKPDRQATLKFELQLMNSDFPMKLCIPFVCPGSEHFTLLRIAFEDSVILNSAERTPFLVFIEVAMATEDIKDDDCEETVQPFQGNYVIIMD